MAELVKVTGMVISTMAVGEYDKRVVILTKERGKIHGFARGAKRPGNSLMAAAQPFVFGEFMLLEGRSAYTISSVKVMNYFEKTWMPPVMAAIFLNLLIIMAVKTQMIWKC